MTIRVALIGAGNMGSAHSRAYQQIEDALIVAVVDESLERANRLALPFGARVFGSLSELIASESVDMVDICTPSTSHKEIAVQCAHAGWHVLVEKPVAHTREDARAMVEAARRAGVFFMVAQVLRFWPEYAYLKQAFESGVYGGLIQLQLSRTGAAPAPDWPGWLAAPAQDNLAAFELHIHDLDFIHYLLGKPTAVQSSGIDLPVLRASYLKTRYVYDHRPELFVEAEGGWWQAPLPFKASYRAIFEQAILLYDQGRLYRCPAGGASSTATDFSEGSRLQESRLKSTDPFYNEVAYFVDCVRGNSPPTIITPDESLASLEILLAELQSSKQNRLVVL